METGSGKTGRAAAALAPLVASLLGPLEFRRHRAVRGEGDGKAPYAPGGRACTLHPLPPHPPAPGALALRGLRLGVFNRLFMSFIPLASPPSVRRVSAASPVAGRGGSICSVPVLVQRRNDLLAPHSLRLATPVSPRHLPRDFPSFLLPCLP